MKISGKLLKLNTFKTSIEKNRHLNGRREIAKFIEIEFSN